MLRTKSVSLKMFINSNSSRSKSSDINSYKNKCHNITEFQLSDLLVCCNTRLHEHRTTLYLRRSFEIWRFRPGDKHSLQRGSFLCEAFFFIERHIDKKSLHRSVRVPCVFECSKCSQAIKSRFIPITKTSTTSVHTHTHTQI